MHLESTLFVGRGAAWFSKDVPCSVIAIWTCNGGSLSPRKLRPRWLFCNGIEDSELTGLRRKLLIVFDMNWVLASVQSGSLIPLSSFVLDDVFSPKIQVLFSAPSEPKAPASTTFAIFSNLPLQETIKTESIEQDWDQPIVLDFSDPSNVSLGLDTSNTLVELDTEFPTNAGEEVLVEDLLFSTFPVVPNASAKTKKKVVLIDRAERYKLVVGEIASGISERALRPVRDRSARSSMNSPFSWLACESTRSNNHALVDSCRTYSISQVLKSAQPFVARHPGLVKFTRGVRYKGGVFAASLTRTRTRGSG